MEKEDNLGDCNTGCCSAKKKQKNYGKNHKNENGRGKKGRLWMVVYIYESSLPHQRIVAPNHTSSVPPIVVAGALDGIFPCPFPRGGLVPCSVGFIDMRDFRHERIIGVGISEHRTD